MPRMSASGKPWTESPKCCNCSSTFGLLRRRHHCRNCGRTVCSECSSGRVLMDGLLVRCCKDCSGRNSSFIEAPAPAIRVSHLENPLAGASIKFPHTHASADSLRLKVNAPFLLGTELSLNDQDVIEKYIGDGTKVQHRFGEIPEESEESEPSSNDQSNIKSIPPFPLASLSNDPPILEYGGWHPLSGTQEERQLAQRRFGLNLAALSPEDMRRWYYGDSPWKLALVPPHGGVAFGVSYTGYRPHGEFRAVDYAGRWRLSHLAVLEAGMGPSSTNSIGMALSRPHFDFNRSGGHYTDRVDVPLFGKVSESRWLVCAYASPNIRLIRCVSGFVDKEEQAFPFALAILRSVTIVDASTNREFTGGDGVISEGTFSQNYSTAPRQGRSGSAPVAPNPLTRPLSEGGHQGKSLGETSCMSSNAPVERCDRKMVVEIWSPTRGRLVMTLEHAPKPTGVQPREKPSPNPRSISSVYGGDTLSSLVTRSMELLGLSQVSAERGKEEKEKYIKEKQVGGEQAAPTTSTSGSSTSDRTESSSPTPIPENRDRTPPRTPLMRTNTITTRCATSWESFLAKAVNKQVLLFNVGGQGSEADQDDGPLSADTVSKMPLCAFCGERIMLRALDALGHTWHPNCFTCVHCSRPLDEGERFYVDPESRGVVSGNSLLLRSTDNHSVHCYDCFIEVSYPRCFGCLAHIINEAAVSAAGQTFHMKCFQCSACSQNMIKGEGSEHRTVRYFEHNGMIYCEADFLRMFADTCRGCAFNLVKDAPGVVTAVGGLWHRECFVCAECGSALMTEDGEGWGVLGGVTYCSEHYQKRLNIEESVLDDASGDEEDEANNRKDNYNLSLQHDPVRLSFVDTPSMTLQQTPEERKLSRYGVVVPPPEARVSELSAPSATAERFRESVVQHVGDEESWLEDDSLSTYHSNEGVGDILRSSLVEDFYETTAQNASPISSPLTRADSTRNSASKAGDSDRGAAVKSTVYTGLRWARKSQSRAVHRGKHIRKQIMKEMSTAETQPVYKEAEPANSLDVSQALRFGVSALLGRDIPGGYHVVSNSTMKSRGRGHSEPRGSSLKRDNSPSRRGLSPERGGSSFQYQHEVEEECTPSSEPYFPEHFDYTTMTQIMIETSFDSPVVEKEEEHLSGRLSSVSGLSATSSASSTAVSFEAHAPAVFKAIRRKFFGMDDEAYFNCMCKSAISEITVGAGKSGSYFLYSNDKRLIVKSVRSSEFPFLVRVLEAYVVHMEANHFHSLLPRFLGLYKVKLPRMPAERLLVMNNVFYAPTESRLPPPIKLKPPPLTPIVPPAKPPISPTSSSDTQAAEPTSSSSPVPLRRRMSIGRAVFSAKETLFGQGKKKEHPSDKPTIPPDLITNLPSSPSSPSTAASDSSDLPPSQHSQNIIFPSGSRPVSEATLRPVVMSQIYDLKGSLLKRFVSEEQQSKGERVLKDLNFCGHHQGTDNKGNPIQARGIKCRKLRVGKERWASLSAALMSDVEWLRAHNIMDYSLLIGVGMVRSRPNSTAGEDEEVHWSHLSASCYSEWVRDTGGLRARDAAEEEKGIVYYLGVIDILQEFNMGKRMESAYKQRLQMMAGKDPGLISAVDASVYGKRFLEFMTNHIE